MNRTGHTVEVFDACRPPALMLVLTLAMTVMATPGTWASPALYTEQIKPLLKERCYACHGALKQKAGLRLDTAQSMRAGGKNGPAIAPGRAIESLLLQRVSSKDTDTRMPPEGEPLTAQQIASIHAWLESGATAPEDERGEDDPMSHWAFQPPVKSRPPIAGRTAGTPESPVDAFIAARRDAARLLPLPPASKAVWLRRVHLDLTGLPPTLAELRAFETDTSSMARERVVDRLLASPQYGERWARHFMDIWRYSDAYGLGEQLRNSQRHMWHWRDWIIESLNTDKGYDRMIREMLAADELAPTDHAALRATGFLARNYYIFNRTTWLDDVVEHTGKAFLGLTTNCSKCHDHKYDPVTHEDYYALRAVFEPYHVRLDELPGEPDLTRNGLPRAFDLHLDRPTHVHLKGDEKNPDTNRVITAAVPVALAFRQIQPRELQLPATAHSPGLQEHVLSNHLRAAEAALSSASAQLEKARTVLAAAQKQEEARAKTTEGIKGTEAHAPSFHVADDFKAMRTDVWTMPDGEWTFVDGVARQSVMVGERRTLQSTMDHPADFVARMTFKHTGGGKWKSVGFCFDVHGKEHVLAYVSAHPPSKVQIAHSDASGRSTYPTGAAQSTPVSTGEIYTLEVKAQGQLLNVSVNGAAPLVYTLAVPRKPGRFELITFDATADFMAFEMKTLPADARLAGGTEASPNPVEAALAEFKHAETAHRAAELTAPAIRSAWLADKAAADHSGDAQSLAAEAARHSAAWELAKAGANVARAELDLLKAASNKKADAEKKLKSAKESHAKALKNHESPGTTYTSLRGTEKASDGPDDKDPKGLKSFPTTSTGRRTALAGWIADRENPLTARVLVNHVWLRHFGQPLVSTMADFGRHGTTPTHPELLDWLAVDFMDHGWSLKHLHRRLVLSATYGLASSAPVQAGTTDTLSEKNTGRDPENRFYWRMNAVRMDAQTVRDSLLHLAGVLRLELGGPSIEPGKSDTAMRRSLYFKQSRDDEHKFLEMFDNANIKECYRRAESILPQQALALANSELTSRASIALASGIQARQGDTEAAAFCRLAFETVLGVPPDKQELDACVQALAAFESNASSSTGRPDPMRARTRLVQALFNHNDFITIR